MFESRELPAGRVHAILAAAMSDPCLLNRWRVQSLNGTEPAEIDAEFDVLKIWRFSGLVTKVRHNDLRPNLPASFAIMDSANIGIRLFASYAETAATMRRQGRTSKAEKIAALVEFLRDWLTKENSIHMLLWDIIRHESTIFGLLSQSVAREQYLAGPDSQSISNLCVPIRRAGLVQLDMSCNPVEAIRRIRSGEDLRSINRADRHFAYSITSDGSEVKLHTINPIAAFLLNEADGRTVSEIGTVLQTAGLPIEMSDLFAPIQDLRMAGLLHLFTHPRHIACD